MARWFKHGVLAALGAVLSSVLVAPTANASVECAILAEHWRICGKESALGNSWLADGGKGRTYLQSTFEGREFSLSWNARVIEGGETGIEQRRRELKSEYEKIDDGWTAATPFINGVEFYESVRNDPQNAVEIALAVNSAILGRYEVGFVTVAISPPEGFDIVEANRFLLSHLEPVQ